MLIEAIGFAAGVLTTLAFVPQVLKTWRSRSSGDLSTAMLTVFAIGLVLWLVYGLARSSWPLVLTNAVTLWLVCFLLILKLRESELSESMRGSTADQSTVELAESRHRR